MVVVASRGAVVNRRGLGAVELELAPELEPPSTAAGVVVGG